MKNLLFCTLLFIAIVYSPKAIAQFQINNDEVFFNANASISFDILANDFGISFFHTINICSPQYGTAAYSSGIVTYTLNSIPTDSSDVFCYTACLNGVCDTAFITIYFINLAPPCNIPSIICMPDSATYTNICVNFCTIIDALINPNQIYSAYNASIQNILDNSFEYTPPQGFEGTDTLMVSGCNNNGLCDTAYFYVHVGNNCNTQNTPPYCEYTTQFICTDGTPQYLYPYYFDLDGNAVSIEIIQQPLNGTLTLLSDSLMIYTPNNNFTGQDFIAFNVCETNTNELYCTQGGIYIIGNNNCNNLIYATDDYPNCYPNCVIDDFLTINVLNNDYYEGDTVTLTIVSNPQYGTATINFINNTITYTPTPNAPLPNFDFFEYEICNNANICDTAMVFLSNNPADSTNNYLNCINDYITIIKNTSITINVLDNDLYNTPISISGINPPLNGTILANQNTITYTPNTNFVGTDSFEYIACDSFGNCDNAMVYIYVIEQDSLNNTFVDFALNDYIEQTDSTPIYINILNNDVYNPLDSAFSISIIYPPTFGQAEIIPANCLGCYTIKYFGNDLGQADQLAYVICTTIAGVLSCDTAIVYISPVCTDGCVWPGDVNADGVANMYDVLGVGLAYNNTGIVRPNASNEWKGQNGENWSSTFNYTDLQEITHTINNKHADCNGDAVIDDNDLIAINQNYGLQHFKNEAKADEDAPTLKVNILSQNISLNSWVEAEITLGTSDIPANNLFGVAFSLNYPSNLINPDSINYEIDDNWMTEPQNQLSFYKPFRGRADIAHSRKNNVNISGYGRIIKVKFFITDNVDGKIEQNVPFELSISNAVMIGIDGVEKTLNTQGSSAIITPIPPIKPAQNLITIYPNPAANYVTIQSKQASIHSIEIYNATGQLLYFEKNINTFKQQLNTNNFLTGLYLIKIVTEQGIFNKKLVIEKK